MEAALTDEYLIYVVISVILPMVVALVTKARASSSVKAYVLLALSAVNGIFLEAQANGGFDGFDWRVAVLGAVVSFVISANFHAGLAKPTGLTGSEGVIAQKTATAGIG